MFLQTDMTRKAFDIVFIAFEGKVDKAGKPYINHLMRVANGVLANSLIRENLTVIAAEVKKLFTDWFNKEKPSKFYFSVPGEKRMNIYINFLKETLGDEYEYDIQKTDYKPFDLKETNVYYVIFKKDLK